MLNNELDKDNQHKQNVDNDSAYVNVKDSADFGGSSADVDLDIAESLDEK